jgi:spermidine/putrescine transport system permease protein
MTSGRSARPGWGHSVARHAPWILLAPGILWLLVFYVVPVGWMLVISLSSGTLESGFVFTGSLDAYREGLGRFQRQFGNSLLYGGAATLLTFLIGFPVAYTVAFRGGRFKNLLLFLVIAPFFTSFLIRTISWKILLGDQGPLFEPLKDVGLLPPDFRVLGSATAVVAGLTYNFLPFMILPLYVALEKIDPRLLEAAQDLYANRFTVLRKVTIPLALPGIFAGSLLTFIPAIGDFINAELLGTPQTQMIGNVIQGRFILQGDYQLAAALSFVLMAAILVAVVAYARLIGTEQLTGG